jgi:uncharacterized protein (DUF849 family)
LNREPFITCAVTGAGDSHKKSDLVPVTPEEIARSSLEAADAGAAVVHIHVRDPVSGAGSRRVELYQEVVERIRAENRELIINLTAGMGGDLEIANENPLQTGPATDFVGALERLAHVEAILPDICTLDCGSYNVGPGNMVYVSTSEQIRIGAERIRELGVKPEIEAFELGHLHFALELLDEGLLEPPGLVQFCLGVPHAAPANLHSLTAMAAMATGRDLIWSAFGVGRMEMPVVPLAAVAGGNVRVGLEDNLYLTRGVKASNADLVRRAVDLLEGIGCRPLGPVQTRERLGLAPPA